MGQSGRVRFTRDNTAVLLIDHQVGLFTGVRDIDVNELKHNVVGLGACRADPRIAHRGRDHCARQHVGPHHPRTQAGARRCRHPRPFDRQRMGRRAFRRPSQGDQARPPDHRRPVVRGVCLVAGDLRARQWVSPSRGPRCMRHVLPSQTRSRSRPAHDAGHRGVRLRHHDGRDHGRQRRSAGRRDLRRDGHAVRHADGPGGLLP